MVSSLPPDLNIKYSPLYTVKGGIEYLEANSIGVGYSLKVVVLRFISLIDSME